MTDTLISITHNLDTKQAHSIELFRERFKILWENWESLKKQGIRLGGSFKNENGKITGDSCNIEIFRLKGYFVDFRFFYAQKEPTNYFNVASLLRGKCTDERFHNLLNENRKTWNEEGILEGWHGYTVDEILNCYFHGEIFHSIHDKRINLNKILDIMNSELAAHVVTDSIYKRMLIIRNLNWVLAPFNINNQVIRLPDEYA